ncbi:hypothetical protein [Bounagaea algeriensis]
MSRYPPCSVVPTDVRVAVRSDDQAVRTFDSGPAQLVHGFDVVLRIDIAGVGSGRIRVFSLERLEPTAQVLAQPRVRVTAEVRQRVVLLGLGVHVEQIGQCPPDPSSWRGSVRSSIAANCRRKYS